MWDPRPKWLHCSHKRPCSEIEYCERRYFCAVYILHYSRLQNVRENIYIVKITFIMLHRGNHIKNAKINPREIVNFRKCAKIYTPKNIYVHSSQNPSGWGHSLWPWYAYSSILGLWKECDLYLFERGVAQDESVFPRLQNLVQPSPIRLHANACKYRRGSFALFNHFIKLV